MGKLSKIEWTDHTWSPWWGCTKVDRGCKNCYAESFSKRVGLKIWGQDARRHMSAEHWEIPLRWNDYGALRKEEYKVFPSMCDPFESRPELEDLRFRFWKLMKWTPNLQWLLLTKRAENVEYYDLPINAHVFASINDEASMHRIAEIRSRRKASRVHGLSIEPLTGPLTTLRKSDLSGIHWVLLGGETGAGAERMRGEWAQHILNVCRDARVPYFFKQWGDKATQEDKLKFSHLSKVQEWPALLGPAVTKK